MAESDIRPCAHPSCHCEVEDGGAIYCSQYCENASHDEAEESACACGHDGCVESARSKRDSGDEPQMSIGHRPENEPGGLPK